MIDSALRQDLRAQAHHLNAVILIGQHGLTPAIITEIDRALNAHELIKIKWKDSEKDDRAQALDTLCQTLQAEPIAHIGKQLIIWRANPQQEKPATPVSQKKATKKPNKNVVAKRCVCVPKKKHYRVGSTSKKAQSKR